MNKMKIRGFELLSIDAMLPRRATKQSCGYDFYAPKEVVIPAHGQAKIVTNVCAYMRRNEFLAIFIRSSLGIKYELELSNNAGIIDSDYYHNEDNMGNIIISIRNNSDKDYTVHPGDRVAQGIFLKYLKADKDATMDKRNGGLGSTSK